MMADANGRIEKVLCFVCNRTAVKGRVFCTECNVWAHIACALKKKCCKDAAPSNNPDIDDGNNFKGLNATINSAIVTDMRKVIGELIEENKKLRLEVEQLKLVKANNINQGFSVLNDETIINEERKM